MMDLKPTLHVSENEQVKVVDETTDEELRFFNSKGEVASYRWHFLFEPKSGGLGKIALVLDDVPVVMEKPSETPLEAYGHTGDGRLPAERTVA